MDVAVVGAVAILVVYFSASKIFWPWIRHSYYRVDPYKAIPFENDAGGVGEMYIAPKSWSVDRTRHVLSFTTKLSSELREILFIPMGPLRHRTWLKRIDRDRIRHEKDLRRKMGDKSYQAMIDTGCQ